MAYDSVKIDGAIFLVTRETMHAEVIAIGDELTSGQRLDTNSQWLSQRLGELGIRVLYHSTVGDDIEANVRVFREAFDRADLIVCTGGLGPTADDLTRQAIAEATGTELVLDEPALEYIKSLFARRKREMPERNTVQAMFPEGSRVVPNPHGSAPGIDMDLPREGRPPSRVFALPGVPAEMKEMWEATVEPALVALGGKQKMIRHKQIKCFGIGESDLEQMLPDLIRRGRTPSVGITVSKATITLRITADGSTPQDCYAAMEPTIATIHECLGDLVFGADDEELQHAVIRLLRQRGQTLATAEWGPGGLLSHWMSEVICEEDLYLGGIVVRNEPALQQALSLSGEQLGTDGPHTVEAMAVAAKERYGADFGLAIGPFPPFDKDAIEPARVRFSLAGPDGVTNQSARFAGHPDILKARSTKQGLNLLRLALIEG